MFYVFSIYFFPKLFDILLPLGQISVHIQKRNYQHVRRDVNLTIHFSFTFAPSFLQMLKKKVPTCGLKNSEDSDAAGQLLLSLLLSAHSRMVKYLECVF